jgi:DNA-binding transcriptional regulator WhiA
MKLPEEIQKAIKEYRRYRRLPSKKVLEELYWKHELSTYKIAKLFNVGQATVHRWFRRYNVKTRDYIEAVILANTKYLKKPFNGSQREKAYMIGFRIGDLSVEKRRRQIRVRVSSTNPSTIQIIFALFASYTVVKKFPCKNRLVGYEWAVYCDLDQSFNFLLKTNIPKWVFENEECFYYFLTGLFDAEGSITIQKDSKSTHGRYSIKRILRISNHNKLLIEKLKCKLTQLGYHPIINRHEGKIVAIILARKKEVIRLALKLPLKHTMKLKWRELLLATKDVKHWDDIKDIVMTLRNRRKNEVRKYIEEAKAEWIRRHNTDSCLVDAQIPTFTCKLSKKT